MNLIYGWLPFGGRGRVTQAVRYPNGEVKRIGNGHTLYLVSEKLAAKFTPNA